MNRQKIIGIIPARYASRRFPGKPLVDVNGKPMIRRVYEQALKSSSLAKVIVATDDDRICDTVRDFGGEVVMTGRQHQSGTDRCAEVVELLKPREQFDIVVNIQGDEPYIDPGQIDEVAALFTDPDIRIATLAKRIDDTEILFSQNVNKVILDHRNFAIYFSRHPIPFQQNVKKEEWVRCFNYYKHIGMYAYRTEILKQITKLPVSGLEKAESLEQLRWIENGYQIKVGITGYESVAIDIPDDLSKILNRP